jgi:hypothetical protein
MHMWRTTPSTPSSPRRASRALLLVVVLLGALAGAGLTSQPAGATGLPDLQCGVNPTTDVRLRADLTCDTGFAGDADHTGAPLVNIDLGGHTLTVINGTCTFFGRCGAIFNEASVSNGKVVGDLKDVRRIDRVRVTGSVYLNEGTPLDSPATLVRSSVRNGRVAVWGSNVTVRKNTISGGGATGGGIQIDNTSRGTANTKVTENWVLDTPGDGIQINSIGCSVCTGSISGSIKGNLVARSGAAGINVAGLLVALGRVDVSGNLLLSNAGDGIKIASFTPASIGGGPIVLTSNRALFNKGHGITSTWLGSDPTQTTVDGGRNVAHFNAVSPQCVGVTCTTGWFGF